MCFNIFLSQIKDNILFILKYNNNNNNNKLNIDLSKFYNKKHFK